MITNINDYKNHLIQEGILGDTINKFKNKIKTVAKDLNPVTINKDSIKGAIKTITNKLKYDIKKFNIRLTDDQLDAHIAQFDEDKINKFKEIITEILPKYKHKTCGGLSLTNIYLGTDGNITQLILKFNKPEDLSHLKTADFKLEIVYDISINPVSNLDTNSSVAATMGTIPKDKQSNLDNFPSYVKDSEYQDIKNIILEFYK